MKDDFEKLDEWMMKAVGSERDKKIPQKELDAFHEELIRKIAIRQNGPAGMPYLGMALAGALSLAVIFGVVLYVQTLSPPKPIPVSIEVKAIVPEPVPAAPVISKTAEVSVPAGITTQPVMENAQAKTEASVSALKEEDILDEIQALKELGAWTEEDEEQAGIPVEIIYSDLEISPESNPSSVSVAGIAAA